MTSSDARHHPSALRNRGPIRKVLLELVSPDVEGLALEIASGSGAHVEEFAPAFPKLKWQPSEYVVHDRSSVLASIDDVGNKSLPNVMPAVALDASKPWNEWPAKVQDLEAEFSLVYLSNVTHISPWSVSCGVLAGAGHALKPGGLLVIYGPFKVNGVCTTESNAAFDTSLRQRDPEWGYRDVSELEAEAIKHGLHLKGCQDMPANNFLLHFQKATVGS